MPVEHTGIALIVRHFGRPIGFLLEERPGGTLLTSDEIHRLLMERIAPHLLKTTVPDANGTTERTVPPPLTIAICTHDHPEDLARCLNVLDQQRRLQWPFEILVVDNAPSTDVVAKQVSEWSDVHYVMEPKPGLNFARNRAVKEASGKILAFIDDDVTVDRYWLAGLRKAVLEHPDAAAFTGLVLPTELATGAQILFERRGGFEKSFETIRYGQSLPGHWFYPCVGGKFGTGCNMAFVRSVLVELGGFDEALDTGPPLPGGGDTDMFYRVVRAGYPLVYEPQLMVFHRHRREFDALRSQYSRSWGQGLMAFAAKTYRYDVLQRPNLRRLVIWWFAKKLYELLRIMMSKSFVPADVLLYEIWGGIVGLSVAYPRSLRRVEVIREQFALAPENSTTGTTGPLRDL